MSKRKKKKYENYKAMLYIRIGSETTSSEKIRSDIQRKLVLKTMSPELVELCERIKRELQMA